MSALWHALVGLAGWIILVSTGWKWYQKRRQA
jgi:hypothetical protein